VSCPLDQRVRELAARVVLVDDVVLEENAGPRGTDCLGPSRVVLVGVLQESDGVSRVRFACGDARDRSFEDRVMGFERAQGGSATSFVEKRPLLAMGRLLCIFSRPEQHLPALFDV
jgi:hypothetical protein